MGKIPEKLANSVNLTGHFLFVITLNFFTKFNKNYLFHFFEQLCIIALQKLHKNILIP